MNASARPQALAYDSRIYDFRSPCEAATAWPTARYGDTITEKLIIKAVLAFFSCLTFQP
jgi:hypothetical protein